ncbi:MAG TPA: hypothetical protein VFZ48_03625 [Candidatus Saccharimonadales bacterium]
MIISVWFEIYGSPVVAWGDERVRASNLPGSVSVIFRSLRSGLAREAELPPEWRLTDFCYAWVRPAGAVFSYEEKQFLERTMNLVVNGSTLIYSLQGEDDCALLVSRYKADFGAFRDSVMRVIRKSNGKPDISTVSDLPAFLGRRP